MARFMILVIAVLFLCGAQKALDQQHLPHINIIQNPGFENGKMKWTNSGSSTFTLETANPLAGSTSARWDSSASTETFSSNPQATPELYEGRACLAVIHAQWGGTAGNLEWRVVDGSANVLAVKDVISSASTTVVDFMRFNCPTAGTTLTLQFYANANSAEMLLDQMWLGGDYMAGSVAQAELYGTALSESAANCTWTTTAGTFGSYAADSDCNVPTVTGSVSAPATKIPAVLLENTGPGKYLITVQGVMQAESTDTNCEFQLHDGTNGSGYQRIKGTSHTAAASYNTLIGSFIYETGQGNVTIEIQGLRNSGTSNCEVSVNTGERILEFNVMKFPLESQQAISIETQGMYWSGYHGTNCKFSRTNTSYGDFTDDASCSFTEVLNQNMGTVATYGASKPGLVFTPARTGVYEICAMFGARCTNNNRYALRMYDGTNVLAETMEQEDAGSGGYPDSVMLCGFLDVTTIAEQSIRLEGSSSAGSLDVELLTGTGGVTTGSIFWTVKPITQQFPQAVVLPTVDSEVIVHTGNGHGSSSTKIRRFTTASTNTGSCITYADSATLGASFTINCDGIYSMTYTDRNDVAAQRIFGITVNTSEPTQSVQGMTNYNDRLTHSYTPALTGDYSVSATKTLSDGDIVRPHTDGAWTNTTAGRARFTIVQTVKQ